MTDRLEPRTDDECLSAWLDGALEPDQREAFAIRLDREPDLMRRLKQIASANAAVRDAYADIAEEPLPAALLEAFGAANTAAGSADIVDLGSRRKERPLIATPPWLAIAAGIAVAIGIGLGLRLAAPDANTELTRFAAIGPVPPDSPLHDALETSPSRAPQVLGESIAVTPVLSFRAVDGDYCRQFDIVGPVSAAEALACRGTGGWSVEAVSRRDPADALPGGGFRPATAGSNAIDAEIDARIDGDAYDAQAEAGLIERGWQ